MTTLTLEKEPTACRCGMYGPGIDRPPYGRGIHLPVLDEDLHAEGILAKKQSGERKRCLRGWKAAMRERRRVRTEGNEPLPWGEPPYQILYSAFLNDGESAA